MKGRSRWSFNRMNLIVSIGDGRYSTIYIKAQKLRWWKDQLVRSHWPSLKGGFRSQKWSQSMITEHICIFQDAPRSYAPRSFSTSKMQQIHVWARLSKDWVFRQSARSINRSCVTGRCDYRIVRILKAFWKAQWLVYLLLACEIRQLVVATLDCIHNKSKHLTTVITLNLFQEMRLQTQVSDGG